MCRKDADRLAGLNQQRLVVLERGQRAHDGFERLPVSRRFSRAAVDDEVVGTFGDVGVEIVHEHPQRRFLRPAFAGQRHASRRANDASGGGHEPYEKTRP